MHICNQDSGTRRAFFKKNNPFFAKTLSMKVQLKSKLGQNEKVFDTFYKVLGMKVKSKKLKYTTHLF